MKVKLILSMLLLYSIAGFGQYINQYNNTNAALQKQDDRAKQKAIDDARQPNSPSKRTSNTPFVWEGPVPEFLKSKEEKAADAAYVAEVRQREQDAYQREQEREQAHKDWLQRIANENAELKRNHIRYAFDIFKPQNNFTDLDIKILGEETFYFENKDVENKIYFKAGKFVPKLKAATMDEPLDTLVDYIWNARVFPDFSLSYLKKLQIDYPAQKSYLERNELLILANYFGTNTLFQSSALGYIYPLCGFELMDDQQKIKILDRFEELEALYPETAKTAAGECRLDFNMFYKYATSNLPLKNKTDAKRLDYLYKTLETVQPDRVLPAGGWRVDTWKKKADLYLRGTAMELKLIYPDFVQSLSSEKWLAISDAYQINVEYIAWAFRDEDYYDERFLKKYPNLTNARKKEFKNETDGDGVLTFKNRDKYKGELKDGKPNGKGVYTSAIGEIYKGNFKDGKLSGQGKANYQKNISSIIHIGDVYEGEFENGTWQGQGTVYNDNYSKGRYKYKKSGNWKNGQLDGEGETSFTDNATNKTRVHKGSYKNGIKMGFGVQTDYDGSIYTGNFADRYQGKGVIKYLDGSILEGQWNDGHADGKGKLTTVKGYVKTYKNEYDKKKELSDQTNIKYYNPNGKEITEAEYNANK
jgi:hypothetical protein